MTKILDKSVSVNNRILVEAYRKEDLKTVGEGTGFVTVSQKVMVKGLKVLMDAQLGDGTLVPKGSRAWIKENDLHAQPWAKVRLQSESMPEPFMIVDLSHVEWFTPPGA